MCHRPIGLLCASDRRKTREGERKTSRESLAEMEKAPWLTTTTMPRGRERERKANFFFFILTKETGSEGDKGWRIRSELASAKRIRKKNIVVKTRLQSFFFLTMEREGCLYSRWRFMSIVQAFDVKTKNEGDPFLEKWLIELYSIEMKYVYEQSKAINLKRVVAISFCSSWKRGRKTDNH